METKSQTLIRQIKEIKQRKKIKYSDIMEALTENGIPAVSLTTLRRIFATNSETRASSFNYEETLLPVYEAVSKIDGSDELPEVAALKTALGLQHEELDRCLEMKDHLAVQVAQLTSQIEEKDALIKRLIDRLDQKDGIIQQLIVDMKQKDLLVHSLTEK